MPINVHQLVRGPINLAHPDEEIALYHSLGQKNVKGEIVSLYADPIIVSAQVQYNEGGTIKQTNESTDSAYSCSFYMNVGDGVYPLPNERQLTRTGDIIRRQNGTWWLITGVKDMFWRSGWICALGTMQTAPPDGVEQLHALNYPDIEWLVSEEPETEETEETED